jgi:hypothetical protein
MQKLGSKQSKVGGDETITDKKPDGKDQPIDQYKLTSKKAGKNTKAIQQGWHDSITMAHTMLVEVNQELSKILKELDDISNKLDKLNKKSELKGALRKFNYVRDKMDAASSDANCIATDFKKLIPKHINKAAEQISAITTEDFYQLEKHIGKKEVKKLKDIFHRVKFLHQNISTNAQDANQSAEPSKKKKPQLVVLRQSSYSDSEEDDSLSEKKVPAKNKYSIGADSSEIVIVNSDEDDSNDSDKDSSSSEKKDPAEKKYLNEPDSSERVVVNSDEDDSNDSDCSDLAEDSGYCSD